MSDRAHNCWFNMQLEEFQFCVKPYSLIKKSCRDCVIDLTGKSLFFINFLLKKKKLGLLLLNLTNVLRESSAL